MWATSSGGSEAPTKPRRAGTNIDLTLSSGQPPTSSLAAIKAAVVVNISAGVPGESRAVVERVSAAFHIAGVEAEVVAVGYEGLAGALARAAASSAEVVVIGGGDGTVRTAAQASLDSGKALGILPFGTRNHFARDAGIPTDLAEAVRIIADGHVREVDVGEVNGEIFINNSSIGLYPSAVDQRNELRHRHGGGKASAMFNACLNVLRRFPLLDVRLQAENRTVSLRTPFVFVGNNRYDMSLFSLGQRASLSGGELGVYLTRNTNRFGVLRLTIRALVGRMRQDRDFRYFTAPHVEIHTRRPWLRVSLDGEVRRMKSPIRYVIRPGALRILAPEAAIPLQEGGA
jgi:diacylglycerol kinase family enzyme